MIVDSSDCADCKHFDVFGGTCEKHGYDVIEMRDGVRECEDYEYGF